MIMGVGPFSLARGLLHSFCLVELIVNMLFFCFSFLSLFGYIDVECIKNGTRDLEYDKIYLIIAYSTFVGAFGNMYYFDLIKCGNKMRIYEESVKDVVVMSIYVHFFINIVQIMALFSFSWSGVVCSDNSRYFFFIGAVLYSFITIVWVLCSGGILIKLIENHYVSKAPNIT